MTFANLIPWRKREADLPVRRTEDDLFPSFREEMDRLMDHFLPSPFDLDRSFDWDGSRFEGFTPRVDIQEDEKNIIVKTDLPGMDEKDIHLSIRDDVLTVSGEKKDEKREEGKGTYRIERTYGSFRRDIPLPVQIEEDKADATFKNGVLTVTLPKSAQAPQNRKLIPVRKG